MLPLSVLAALAMGVLSPDLEVIFGTHNGEGKGTKNYTDVFLKKPKKSGGKS